MPTIPAGELDLDHFILVVIQHWSPTDADLALWTHRLVLLPIDLELRSCKPGLFLRLPAIIQSSWPKQIDTLRLLAFD